MSPVPPEQRTRTFRHEKVPGLLDRGPYFEEFVVVLGSGVNRDVGDGCGSRGVVETPRESSTNAESNTESKLTTGGDPRLGKRSGVLVCPRSEQTVSTPLPLVPPPLIDNPSVYGPSQGQPFNLILGRVGQ